MSVVVPTHGRPEALQRCLDAIARQRAHFPIEVIVVDDGSAAASRVAAVANEGGARPLRIARAGVSAARNHGVAASRGRYVCFTDDDCEPAADWLAVLRSRLSTGAPVVMGRTENGHPDDGFASASQLIANAFAQAEPVHGPAFAPGSNVGCRREVAIDVPFDERYLAAGDDRDWFARLAAAGYEVAYEPAAIVLHKPELDFGAFWRKHVRYGRSAREFRRTHTSGRLEPLSFYGRLLGRGFREGAAVGMLVAVAQVATAVGYLRGAVDRRTA